MTTRKGNLKKQGQKYQNTVAFNPQKWGTSEKQLRIAATPIGAVCQRCCDKLEWRKKYNKYKPLKMPASCEFCKQRSVKHAYHKACLPCAKERNVCAMCKAQGEVVDLPPSREEQLRLAQMREVELKSLRERERRTLIRKQEREEARLRAAEKGEDVPNETEESAQKVEGKRFDDQDDAPPPGSAADLEWEEQISDDEAT